MKYPMQVAMLVTGLTLLACLPVSLHAEDSLSDTNQAMPSGDSVPDTGSLPSGTAGTDSDSMSDTGTDNADNSVDSMSGDNSGMEGSDMNTSSPNDEASMDNNNTEDNNTDQGSVDTATGDDDY